jgi:uncharacterized membrane protein
MTIDWAHAGPSMLAAFLAALVEFVEALTIILAVGTIRGWRSAIVGAIAGVVTLTLLVLAFGPALQQVPLAVLQLVVGVLLLLFGMRWLRKAALRSAGVIGLHDETAIYAKQTKALRADGPPPPRRLDALGVVTTFKAVILEGLEVVFIVIAVGAASSTLVWASIGAAAAGLVVISLGLMLHRPLARVPENALKYVVGVLLSAFGTFWIGEGLHFAWPRDDLSLLALAGGFFVISWVGVLLARRGTAPAIGPERAS